MKPEFYHYAEARQVALRAEDDAGDEVVAGAPGTPTEKQLATINERCALVPQAADDLFVWGIEISNNRVDSHGTWMDHGTSLVNYERQANTGRGIPYLRHHDTRADEMGRVFAGRIEDAPELDRPPAPTDAPTLARDMFREPAKAMRLVEMVYTRRDIAPDLIARLESGISASNSIGFSVYTPADPGSMLECDICGVDLFQMDAGGYVCPHIPGFDYTITRGEGDDAEQLRVIATAKVVNASQREASGVYLGSTPGTFTLADRVAALFHAGQVGEGEARRFEEMHRLTRGYVVGDRRTIYDMGGRDVRPGPMTQKVTTSDAGQPPTAVTTDPDATARGQTDGGEPSMDPKELLDRVRALLGGDQDRVAAFELADGDKEPITALHRVLTDEVDRERVARTDAENRVEAQRRMVAERLGAADSESLADALNRVMTLAKLGEGARDRLIEDLLRQMTRAGIEYEADAQRAIAARMTPEEIEAQTKMYKTTADKRFTPGRVSDPNVEARTPTVARRPDPATVS